MFELNKKSTKKVSGGNTSPYLNHLSRVPLFGRYFARPMPVKLPVS